MFDPAKFLRRLGKFFLIPIGVSLVLGAGWSAWSTQTWIDRSDEAEGKVIEMVRIRDRDDGGYMFAPLVRFQTGDGRSIEFQSSLRSNPPGYRTGQTVTVLYDPDAPESAAIRGLFSLWLGFMGSIFTAIGTAMVFVSSRVTKFSVRYNVTVDLAGSPPPLPR
jgi:hypothetical protein